MIITVASTILLFLAFAGFAARRGLTYMHAYQQEEYDSPRFLSWMWAHTVFDKRLSLLILCITVIFTVIAPYAFDYINPVFINFPVFLLLVFAAVIEKDPRKASKKKLVMTARAKRIFFPAYMLVVLSAAWIFLLREPAPLLWLINIHLIPFAIVFVNMMLAPFEEINQKKYWNEAHNKVRDLKPTVIGITGSFGKTSVKHILGHVLKSQASTLITPGSVNTPMGISRIIREQLDETHKYLIVEMGAYGKGSIERLCDLTPPDFGIITAIGHAHYERFKSLDMVARTKYELAEAVLGRGGKMVVHERTLRFEHARAIKEQNENQFIVCGETPAIDKEKQEDKSYLKKGDLVINRILQKDKGLEVRFNWKQVDYNVDAPLYGLHHGHNIVLAFVAAIELGISSADIQAALSSLPQIEHRLEVKKQAGLTIIDDAYNSNPIGFQAALGLLSDIGKKGRKILITPGMVELGAIHNEAHKKVGEYAGEVCDVAIVVQGKRIPSFIKGFKKTGANKTLHEVNSFAEAQIWINKNKQDGDVVLLENDLPDIYERVPKI